MCKFVSGKKLKYLVPCYKYYEESYGILREGKLGGGFWEGGNGLENYYLFMWCEWSCVGFDFDDGCVLGKMWEDCKFCEIVGKEANKNGQ